VEIIKLLQYEEGYLVQPIIKFKVWMWIFTCGSHAT